ncbi:AAA family ATPase [Actinomycetospora chlora]|uniref:AAA family ATPase n=1 Tax=Actinomycetospora chlora TaxID=663608 RepID=A0ABP9BZ19_9PSEU
MSGGLLERDVALGALEAALAGAEAGTGGLVLVSGEAGIGKTTLVRAFAAAAADRARVLLGACDDLLTPRALGPLHDVVAAAPGGPLAAALERGRDEALSALGAELSTPGRPTVLVVEDVHWADEATLDVLRWVGRRVAGLPAVVVLTYRDGEVDSAALRRTLGELQGPAVHRVRLEPLSRSAVALWSGGTTLTTATLYAMSGGNPFYVSEVLAAPDGAVPPTVVDAVLARVGRLDPVSRSHLEQLSVVPSRVGLPLARALLGDLDAVGDAERHGIVEIREHALAFRHELARRAIEGALTAGERIRLNARVLAALLAQDGPDPARVVHHAAAAGDDVAVVRHAPRAAALAVRAGAPRQGAGHHEQTLARAHLLDPAEHARVAEAYAWTQYHADRPGAGVAAGETAVRLREEQGDPEALATALASLSVLQWADLRIDAALASGERAVALLEGRGDTPARVYATVFLGTLLVNIDREAEAITLFDTALAAARRSGWHDLDGIARVFRGRSLMQRGDPDGLADCDAGIALARRAADHQGVMIGYLNTVCGLWRAGRYDDLGRYLDAGAAYGRDREYRTLDLNREWYRYQDLLRRGDWDAAEAGLTAMRGPEPGDDGLDRFALPDLARLAVRRGDDGAAALLAAARASSARSRSSFTSTTTALAGLEHGWSLGGAVARRAIADATALLAEHRGPGRGQPRGEIARWLRRVGEPVAVPAGCPEEWAAGLRGRWRDAADAFERLGAPYERALELAESGDLAATAEALEVLDRLGAAPAAAWARRRLRALGARTVPRGPQATTRAHPVGLTGRQAEILGLLADGLTNAEIADRLVVSVRTVDHHVSAVLAKLGTTSRRDAVAAAARLGVLAR